MRDVHMNVEQRGTVNFDLREQRAERAVLGVMPGGAESGAGLVAISGRGALCRGSVRMTATAGGLFGSAGVDAARSVAAGPITARQQRMERLPEQPERAECNQRGKRHAAIHSGNQG